MGTGPQPYQGEGNNEENDSTKLEAVLREERSTQGSGEQQQQRTFQKNTTVATSRKNDEPSVDTAPLTMLKPSMASI